MSTLTPSAEPSIPVPAAAKRRRAENTWLGIGVLVLAVVVWEIVCDLHWVKPIILAAPHQLGPAAVSLSESGALWRDILVSLKELVVGFGLSCAVGIPVGGLMGIYPGVEEALQPLVWFFYSAPLIAFFPIFIVWLGMGFPTIVALTFLMSVFPLMVNTAFAVKNVDTVLRQCAYAFGYSPTATFLHVTIPASLPTIVAGIRIGAGRAMIGVIAGEFFGATSGLGYLISDSGALLKIPAMYVALVVVIIMGVAITQGFSWLESRAEVWRQNEPSKRSAI